jgi:hypothetical protein
MFNNKSSRGYSRGINFPLLFIKKGIKKMKIINKNIYKIMFGKEFIMPNEVKDIEDEKMLKILLNQPNVEEYVDIEELKVVEEENKKLKEQLAKEKSKSSKSKTK